MATFGHFMRTTMYNFRMFWSASFGASGGPLVIVTEETMADDMQANDMQANEIEPEGQAEIEVEESTLPLLKETDAVDSEQSMPENGSDMIPAEPETDVVEIDTPAADAPEGELSDIVVPEADAPETVRREEAALTDEETAESEGVIQGELELKDTEGLPAPDIQVESHGKRLGLTMLLESLLFVSDEPVEASQLAKALNISTAQAKAGLKRLDTLYETTTRGLRVQVLEGRYQLVTAPETANAIEDFLNLDLTTKLSGPALEALAVVAYRQPATRAQIEAVRGVDCAGVLRSLAQRGLIEEMGRLNTVGRPILYGVTDLFMQHFGLIELGGLPPLETDDEDMLWAATKLAEMELEEG